MIKLYHYNYETNLIFLKVKNVLGINFYQSNYTPPVLTPPPLPLISINSIIYTEYNIL